MELEKKYCCLEQTVCVCSKNIECEEEHQETLAQYCDDFNKIVKCSIKNRITSSNISNGTVKIYGKSFINLSYTNENNELIYTDFEESFEKSFNYSNLSDSAFLKINCCDKYCNFRLINQRRIDIHNSFIICVDIYDKETLPCIYECENSRLKKSTIKSTHIHFNCLSKCDFDEEIEIPSDSQPIKRIVGYSGYATFIDAKIIKDKTLIKGCVSLNIIYTQDNNDDVAKCEHTFDITKIVDIPGIVDTDKIIANLKLGNVFLKSKNSQDGCLNRIEAIGDVCLDISVMRENDIPIVCDGYVLNSKSNCTYNEFKYNKNSHFVSDEIQKEFEIKLNENIDKIIDIDLCLNSFQIKNNECIANISSNVFYCTNSQMNNTNIQSEISLFKDDFDSGIFGASVVSFDYVIKDECTIKIKITISYNALVYKNSYEKILQEIECSEDKCNYPALTLYFAKENELVWNIAKKFSSDIELIKAENELKSDILSTNKVLIIPGI